MKEIIAKTPTCPECGNKFGWRDHRSLEGGGRKRDYTCLCGVKFEARMCVEVIRDFECEVIEVKNERRKQS